MTSASEEIRPLRLLFMVLFPPWFGGSHGVGHVAAALIGRLAERHSVALVCIRGEDEPPTEEDIALRCDLLEEVIRPEKRPRGLWRNRVRQLAKLAGAPPNLVEHASVEGYADRLRSALSAFQPEIVQIEMTEMAQYLPVLAGCSARRVLVDLDPGPAAASNFSSSARGPRRLWRRLDTLRQQEISGVRRHCRLNRTRPADGGEVRRWSRGDHDPVLGRASRAPARSARYRSA